MLQGVARSFALTIAQLPDALRNAGSNLYLLCRIADTIEDEPALSATRKEAFSARWVEVVEGRAEAAPFARELGACLPSAATDAERCLVAAAARVVDITRGLRSPQRRALERCVRIMTRGMVDFQHRASPHGLQDVSQLDRYCYHVAGVVGETLTDLFCDYSTEIEGRREELLPLSVSFGQGLQMINVLKDIWEDRRRGACWLPQDVFRAAGVDDLCTLSPGNAEPGFFAGLTELVAITHRHLANALRYILHPSRPRDRDPPVVSVASGARRAHAETHPCNSGVHERAPSPGIARRHVGGGLRHQRAGALQSFPDSLWQKSESPETGVGGEWP